MIQQFLSVNRIIGEVPTYLTLNGKQVEVPRQLSASSETISLSKEKGVVRSSFIHEAIGHILNSQRLEDTQVKIRELDRALAATDKTISSHIKNNILKRPYNTGFVAFSQTTENIGEDEILISEETYRTLIGKAPRWEECSTVIVTRYPNLGPRTTVSLKLVVNRNPAPINSHMADLLKGIPITDEKQVRIGCVYLHQNVLKGCLEGDADGDMIFMIFEKRGQPTFREVNLLREQGEIEEDDIKTLLRKSAVNRSKPENEYLASKIDKVPIGKATYVIKWKLFFKSQMFKLEFQPLTKTWQIISPWAINIMEFVFDIRKGDFTEDQINYHTNVINKGFLEITNNKKEGNWFANSVTSSTIENIQGFHKRFPTAQAFVNYCQRINEEAT